MKQNRQKRGAAIAAAAAAPAAAAAAPAARTNTDEHGRGTDGVQKWYCESCGRVYDAPAMQLTIDGDSVPMCIECCVPLEIYTGIAPAEEQKRHELPHGWTTRAMECAGARQMSMDAVLMPIEGLFV